MQENEVKEEPNMIEERKVDIEQSVVSNKDVKEYWDLMWEDNKDIGLQYKDYLLEYLPGNQNTDKVFPIFYEFQEIIQRLPNWKAAGRDGVFNFFIKYMTSLHESLYGLVIEVCLGNLPQKEWFYMGLTYLIPKGIPKTGGDYRPITCMSNL